MTAEVVQQMVVTLQAGLKDFHNKSLSENQKILQSSQKRELLLDAQAKQLESIQELAKQVLRHAQAAAEGSNEALTKAKEADERTPELNGTIKEVNDGWQERDDKLIKFARETSAGQERRDEELNRTLRAINSTLLIQHDKQRDIEELVEAIEGQVADKTFVADPEVQRRSNRAAPAEVPKEDESQDLPTPQPCPASPFKRRSFVRESTAAPKKESKQHPKETTFMNQTTKAGTLIPKEARTKKPELFSGKQGKEARAFLMRMEIYFGDYNKGTFSDGRKTTALLMNMGPIEAADWAQPLLKKVSEKDTQGPLKSWGALKAAFLLHFVDPVKREKAIWELGKLAQTRALKPMPPSLGY
ncbi:hypothetical protein FS749_009709 [Ceratobasidium sp. UAMH 11750]|nr:hypothetical protein FS749_009709 [Ceratobasidium sp. UAMH 11750]